MTQSYSYNSLLSLWVAVALLSSSLGGAPAISPEFDWQEIPDSSYILPTRPYLSDSFHHVGSATDSITVSFLSDKDGEPPEESDRFRTILVVPKGDIRSFQIDHTEPLYLKNGGVIQPSTPVTDPVTGELVTHRTLGEWRGAFFHLVEFNSLTIAKDNAEVDSIWINHATITFQPGRSFSDSRPISPLVKEAVESVALNAGDFASSLSRVHSETWTDSVKDKLWSAPTLKIRTRGEGWYAISARRILGELGTLEIENLSLTRRGPYLSPQLPRRWQPKSKGDDRKTTAEFFFVESEEGTVRLDGKLSANDKFVFYAEESDSPYDPHECYWLSVEADQATRDEGQGIIPDLTPEVVTLAKKIEFISKDRLFVEGGLRTNWQGEFFVDSEFPEGTTAELEFAIPGWVRDSRHPVKTYFRLLYGSVSRRAYSPPRAVKKSEIEIVVAGEVVPLTHGTPSPPGGRGRYGLWVSFSLPLGATAETFLVRYKPIQDRGSPLYLDDLSMESQQALVWKGEDCHFEWRGHKRGSFHIESATGNPPAFSLGRTWDGRWGFVTSEIRGDEIVCQSDNLVKRLHLLNGQDWKIPETIERFRMPDWLLKPPVAEELIITPRVFERHVAWLCDMNKQEGTTCAAIQLDGLFDLFTGGRFSPYAVRRFLEWAADTFPDPQPSSMLLVGDSSWDAWGRFPHSDEVPNWTPSLHKEKKADYPSDHWFIEGDPDDLVGDWFLGRLPCQTTQHFESYLAKRTDFNQEPRGNWTHRLVWTMDNGNPFEKKGTEMYYGAFPAHLRLDHIRVREFPFADNFYYQDNLENIQAEAKTQRVPLDFGKISPSCNEAFRKSLSAGSALVVYYGHSGLNVLAHERILFGGGSKHSDIPNIRNGGKCPLTFLMTCDVGRFDYAEKTKWSVGLGEEMLFSAYGGALGIVASTGRGIPADHQALLKGCLEALLSQELNRAGPALWSGKVRSLLHRPNVESIDMFTLFGDPLFEPAIPQARPVRAKSLRWNRDGTLDVEMDISEFPPSGTIPPKSLETVWRIGDDLAEKEHWKNVQVGEGGTVMLQIARAWDLETLQLGVAHTFADTSDNPPSFQTGGFGVRLGDFDRPDPNALYSEGLPNLSIKGEDIVFENYSPQIGETLFALAWIENSGSAVAENVRVAAYPGSATVPVMNFVERDLPKIRRLLPGERERVRLRWDQWDRVGEQKIRIQVDPRDEIQESDESDNEATKTVRILDKADLGWGVSREETSEMVDFTDVRAIPQKWLASPQDSDLGIYTALIPYLNQVDQGEMVRVPFSNFGETASTTTTIQIDYWKEGEEEPFLSAGTLVLPPVEPSRKEVEPVPLPVLLLPGVDSVTLEVDPDNRVDEQTHENNRLEFEIPAGFWKTMPVLIQRRSPPKILQKKSE